MKWKWFGGACIIVGALLIKVGVPVLPVLLGMGIAGYFTWVRQRAASPPARKP